MFLKQEMVNYTIIMEWIGIEKLQPDSFGFIYKITELSTGKQYIGKKQLVSIRTKVIAEKKRKVKSESDWKKYYSSNEYLKKHPNKEDLKREILYGCKSKGELNYCETKELFKNDVLESDLWLNENIASRYFKKNVLKYR